MAASPGAPSLLGVRKVVNRIEGRMEPIVDYVLFLELKEEPASALERVVLICQLGTE